MSRRNTRQGKALRRAERDRRQRSRTPDQGPRAIDVDGQIAGQIGGVADVVGEDGEDGERGQEVGVVGVETAKVAGIRVLQIRVSIEIRLAEVHRDQAAASVGAQPGTVFI